ncbi:Lrp/AsnC family transcriptional regulator [Rhizosaccharibacter radicis]|uniref:Lrp/AsnC family transcriptional regulator n=1 Tax=Rhizosaccharibacter radicis TaxID=2782605 RepID=A0ABT1W136_9PROT|nr:Lrp/AsnC family transcriptional regulator [Acetobacteraceae bacterium KSS12]
MPVLVPCMAGGSVGADTGAGATQSPRPRANLRPMERDGIDGRLIEMLGANARLPAAELGRRLGLSRTTVQSRIERLERDGAILGYTVRLPAPSPAGVSAHVLVTLAPKKTASVEAMLRRMPQVRELHAVSGNVDLVAYVRGRDTDEIDQVIDRIGALDGVVRTNSMIVLSTRISR